MQSLYDDEASVLRLTHGMLAAGSTVFELWLLDHDEREHARLVLDALPQDPPADARVLDLGSGVGGMARWWADLHPGWRFTLVNRSPGQLALTVCPGALQVCCDLLRYPAPYDREAAGSDVVLLAYVLGHVDVRAALRKALACARPGGMVVVLDVFDTPERFNALMRYRSPSTDQLHGQGFIELKPRTVWQLSPLVQRDVTLASTVYETTPGLWVRHV
jgi:SAM-dependent methyltransferase